MTNDPQSLARELRGGSAEAWHALYDAYAEAVWRCVARRVGPHAAEVADIVQETFLAAARARDVRPCAGARCGSGSAASPAGKPPCISAAAKRDL